MADKSEIAIPVIRKFVVKVALGKLVKTFVYLVDDLVKIYNSVFKGVVKILKLGFCIKLFSECVNISVRDILKSF